ncbi:hypothetical protein KA005_34245, partial [bacterium]|nr:hypothetical protein [bacterium]
KIDFNYKFVNLDGKIIPEGPDRIEEDAQGKKTPVKSPPFTLRTACTNILLMSRMRQITCPKCKHVIEKPEELSPEEKSKRYQLATRIYGSKGLLDLQSEPIALLKKLIGKHHPEIIAGQAWEILDPHSAGDKK